MRIGAALADGGSWLAAIGAAALSAVATAFVAWLAWPKVRAEAVLTEQQAESAVWGRWQREIARLEKIISEQGRQIGEMRTQIREMAEGELTYIRALASRDGRIAELEAIIASATFPASPQTAAMLRIAHGVPHDEESARLEQRALEGLADAKGSDGASNGGSRGKPRGEAAQDG